MKKQCILLILSVAFINSMHAGGKAVDLPAELPHALPRTSKKLWGVSIAALAATNAMDVQSSWGKRELNQNLASADGRFGKQGTFIKLGIVSGVCALEYLLLHRSPSAGVYRKLAIVNFLAASITGGMAVRNYGIPRDGKP